MAEPTLFRGIPSVKKKKKHSTPIKGVCIHCGGETCLKRITRCRACRNKHWETPRSKKQKSFRPCRWCGKAIGYFGSKFCSPECHYKGNGKHLWTESEDNIIKASYALEGCESLSRQLGIPARLVRGRANKLKVRLSKDAAHRIVHARAREHMLSHNPSKTPEGRARIKAWFKTAKGKKHKKNLMIASKAIDKKVPSKLEQKLHSILRDLGVEFEISVYVKPSFFVDVRIGNVIIEADGDYWHGHPRFTLLTERQQKQQVKDRSRDKYLRACGYTVERIWESDMDADTVKDVLIRNQIPFSDTQIDSGSSSCTRNLQFR